MAQMECVRFLIESRGAEVNQRDRAKGWTPLHRAARMAHHTHAPYLAVFEYLLRGGADAGLLTTVGWPDPATVRLLVMHWTMECCPSFGRRILAQVMRGTPVL